jgi:hypothetical protein
MSDNNEGNFETIFIGNKNDFSKIEIDLDKYTDEFIENNKDYCLGLLKHIISVFRGVK